MLYPAIEVKDTPKEAITSYPSKHMDYSEGIEALQAYPGEEQHLEERLRHIFLVALEARDYIIFS